jgi:hypothetical protein
MMANNNHERHNITDRPKHIGKKDLRFYLPEHKGPTSSEDHARTKTKG